MKIDSKDLIPLKQADFRFGGYFYFLLDSGDYATMKITEEMIRDWEWKARWRDWLQAHASKLFLQRCAPWSAMSGRQPDWEVTILQR